MPRKKIFHDRRGGDVFVGGRRRTLDFEQVERNVRPRRPPLRGPREDRTPPGAFQGRGSRRRGRGFRLTGAHVALGFIVTGGLAFLLYFLVFIMPSPIGGLSPVKGSYVKAPTVEVKASFKRAVKPSQVALKVDGRDAMAKASVTGKAVASRIALEDGVHRVNLELNVGGLMSRRTATWSFVVDTTPPVLELTEKKVSPIKGTDQVEVSFKGRTEKGARVTVGERPLSVDSAGRFSGKATGTRERSLKISATDAAGNEANAYVVTQKSPAAKGAHVSVYIASSEAEMSKMIGLLDRTELNALQIDLKDEAGQLGFVLDDPVAKQISSVNDYIRLDNLVDRLRYKNVYTICRVVCFKDPKLAKGRTDLAVHDKSGDLWGKGQWTDPYSMEVWEYNLAVAAAAAKAGFHEVQFDYVRFPSDGDITTCVFPHKDSRKPGEVIDGFLAYARERLAEYNVFVSADLFGLTASAQGEMGIGQKVKDVARRVDFISPMVYPSHYNSGEYGVKSPENNPGDIVTKSLEDFKKAMAGTQASLRPWLQDFSLRVSYTPDMVRRQIDACEKIGVDQWLLWDPDCTYSEEALKKR